MKRSRLDTMDGAVTDFPIVERDQLWYIQDLFGTMKWSEGEQITEYGPYPTLERAQEAREMLLCAAHGIFG